MAASFDCTPQKALRSAQDACDAWTVIKFPFLTTVNTKARCERVRCEQRSETATASRSCPLQHARRSGHPIGNPPQIVTSGVTVEYSFPDHTW